MIVWNKNHHHLMYDLSTGKEWEFSPCIFREEDIDHSQTVIHKPIVNRLRDDCLIFQAMDQERALVHDWDLVFNPYLLIKEVHYKPKGTFSDLFYFYVGFDGPEELAVLWKLSL